jgi:inhibitor of cysteine peptidase
MNKKFLLLFFPAVLIIFFLVFWSISNFHKSDIENTKKHVVKEVQTYDISTEDNGSTINIKRGDRLNVSLLGNPSTGYSWEVVGLDTNILEQDGEMVIKNSIPDEQVGVVTRTVVGGLGTFNFSFVANKSGEALLHFVYRRHWEKDIEPIDTFYLNVNIQD